MSRKEFIFIDEDNLVWMIKHEACEKICLYSWSAVSRQFVYHNEINEDLVERYRKLAISVEHQNLYREYAGLELLPDEMSVDAELKTFVMENSGIWDINTLDVVHFMKDNRQELIRLLSNLD